MQTRKFVPRLMHKQEQHGVDNSYLFAFHLFLSVLSHFACRRGFVLHYDGALYLQDMNECGRLLFEIKRSQKYSRGATI